MDNAMLANLALLLQGGNKFGGQTFGGNKFGGNTFGGNTFGASAPQSVNVKATPPALPSYQPLGMSLPDMQSYLQKQGQGQPAAAPMPQQSPAMPPQPAAAPADPNAAASALQSMTSPTTVPPMPASTPIGMAPGMGAQDQGMVAQILAALKARDPQLPPQMAMGQYVS